MNIKIVLFIILIVVIAMLGFAVWYMLGFNEPAKVLNEQNKEPTPLLSLLTVIDNNVKVKVLKAADFEDVKEKAQVGQGSRVKTSLTGRAVIESSDATTVVDKNSEVVIADHSEENKTKFQIEAGNLWAKVKKVFSQGEYYKIETPNSVATVRGTSFGVFYQTGITTVLVAESIVEVISLDVDTKEQIGEVIMIKGGEKAIIANGKEPLVSLITDDDKRLEWYQFNEASTKIPLPKERETTKPSSPSPTIETSPNKNPSLAPNSTNINNTVIKPDYFPAALQNQILTPEPGSTSNSSSAPSNNQVSTQEQVQTFNHQLQSVSPTVLSLANGDADFWINGKNLNDAVKVFVDKFAVNLLVLDSNTIKAQVTKEVPPGTYDVSVLFSNNETLTLSKVLTIR
ncbi:MAG: FecR family protein [Patescibacteria group bacterium]